MFTGQLAKFQSNLPQMVRSISKFVLCSTDNCCRTSYRAFSQSHERWNIKFISTPHVTNNELSSVVNGRWYSNSQVENHAREELSIREDTVRITYVDRDGERHVLNGKVGDNVMYLAQKHELEIEGACDASLACCTCHVYVEGDYFDQLEEITEEEEDMLDLAPFLQENSRLSCQIHLTKELNGIEVRIPSATRNFYVDGHKPKPH